MDARDEGAAWQPNLAARSQFPDGKKNHENDQRTVEWLHRLFSTTAPLHPRAFSHRRQHHVSCYMWPSWARCAICWRSKHVGSEVSNISVGWVRNAEKKRFNSLVWIYPPPSFFKKNSDHLSGNEDVYERTWEDCKTFSRHYSRGISRWHVMCLGLRGL